jgi:2-amino-4-hydroxy-6-hydroxymethyldihydropteridine diphosphokinase
VSQLAHIGLGSNLDDPRAQVTTAIAEIGALPGVEIVARSSLYSSPPMGPQDQPHYINAALAVTTRLSSHALLDALQMLERAHGRSRDGVHWGPRTLDLDILLYGDEQADGPRLHLPHPGLKERDFVVLPLLEIAPAMILPDGESLASVAARLADSASAVRIDDA